MKGNLEKYIVLILTINIVLQSISLYKSSQKNEGYKDDKPTFSACIIL